ncbi:MAG: TIGR01212 family radical SAM protein [Bacillota bacterium]
MTRDIARYNIYSEYLKKLFGEKVYKIPVNLPGTCPNRDGTVGQGGCIFCDEEGAGFQCLPSSMSVKKQIEDNKEYFKKRFNAKKFIVYFQAFTNTYTPFSLFKENILGAISGDVVGISISTRPDCINDRYLDFLKEVKENYSLEIDIELGLQTVNYHTLKKINRGHTLAEFIDSVIRIHKRQFNVCSHIILNLPWDETDDSIESAKIISALGIRFAKLHSLYVVDNTVLGEMYKNNEFEISTLEEYIDRLVLFLEYLNPRVVIQRLVGKGPEESLLFSNWGTSWWKIKQAIENELIKRDTWQGKKFNYLNGSALTRGGLTDR